LFYRAGHKSKFPPCPVSGQDRAQYRAGLPCPVDISVPESSGRHSMECGNNIWFMKNDSWEKE